MHHACPVLPGLPGTPRSWHAPHSAWHATAALSESGQHTRVAEGGPHTWPGTLAALPSPADPRPILAGLGQACGMLPLQQMTPIPRGRLRPWLLNPVGDTQAVQSHQASCPRGAHPAS